MKLIIGRLAENSQLISVNESVEMMIDRYRRVVCNMSRCPKCNAGIDKDTGASQNGSGHFDISNIVVVVIMLFLLSLLFCEVPMRVFYAIGTWIASLGNHVIWM